MAREGLLIRLDDEDDVGGVPGKWWAPAPAGAGAGKLALLVLHGVLGVLGVVLYVLAAGCLPP